MGRMFGTNGVRGIVNSDMTVELALQMGKAIGSMYKGVVAIATDTRSSAEMIRLAVSSGLMSVGVKVLNIGVLPTPALQYYVKTHGNVDGGVMITASHNPPQFNGIKCISHDGTEANRAEEEGIEELYATEIPTVPWNSLGMTEDVSGVAEAYIDEILNHVDVELIRASGLKVTVDCANGAAFNTTPMLLRRLNVKSVTLNCNPEGEIPDHPSEPTEENLGELIAMTQYSESDLGIAHDGDADRCVFITRSGKYVSGDKSLALMCRYALDRRKGSVVTPVSTSSMVEEVVVSNGGTIDYTAVGSPIVARRMMDSGAVFGGEENGGLIFPEIQYCRDGAMTLAKMIELIVRNGPLDDQIATLPVYHTFKVKVECPDKLKDRVIRHIINMSSDQKVDDTDGLKIPYDDGWVLTRPSGTEPLFRIYSESKDEDVALARARKYEKMVTDFLAENR